MVEHHISFLQNLQRANRHRASEIVRHRNPGWRRGSIPMRGCGQRTDTRTRLKARHLW